MFWTQGAQYGIVQAIIFEPRSTSYPSVTKANLMIWNRVCAPRRCRFLWWFLNWRSFHRATPLIQCTELSFWRHYPNWKALKINKLEIIAFDRRYFHLNTACKHTTPFSDLCKKFDWLFKMHNHSSWKAACLKYRWPHDDDKRNERARRKNSRGAQQNKRAGEKMAGRNALSFRPS